MKKTNLEFLKNIEKILILGSEKPLIDDICAIEATRRILSKNGKKVTSLLTKIPQNLNFLGDFKFENDLGESGDFIISVSTKNTSAERVKYNISEDSIDISVSGKSGRFSPKDVSFKKNIDHFDAIFVFGANSYEKMGIVFEQNATIFADSLVINFSENSNNESFGKINFVEPTASSVCEILFEKISQNKELSLFLTKDVVTLLATGIISKTDSFLNKNTTAKSLEICGNLQKMGVDQSNIIENLFKQKSLQTLKIWGRILGNLAIDENYVFSWSSATKADFEISESIPSNIADFSNELLRHAESVDFTVLFIEHEDKTNVEIRSSKAVIDFEEMNKLFGNVGEQVLNGLNFEVEGKTVAEIEADFLRILRNFQQKRLNLPKDIKPKKMKTVPFKKDSFQIEKEKLSSPLAPENIPFDAPLQPHEKSLDLKNPIDKKSAEIIFESKEEVLDFLRKKVDKS
jgi:phosphoesterase RecJ-like protein